MNDSLTNIAAVQDALTEYNTHITKLKNTLDSLRDNKTTFITAWVSSNATSFFRDSYINLIAKLDNAYTSLSNYQGKISRVVNAMVEFDTKVEYGANSNQSQDFTEN